MAAKKVKITYLDGREEVLKVPPRAQVMTEEYCGGFRADKAILATFYLGWAALNKAGKESLDFETWLDKIDDVEDYEDPKPDPEAEPGPTPPAPSGDGSSDSPS